MGISVRRTAAAGVVAVVCAAGALLADDARAAQEGTAGQPAQRTVRVSTASDGTQADGPSGSASLSANGRYVAFWSAAPNLGGDFFQALLVKDLRTGVTTRVPDARAYGGSRTAISADGRYVGYGSGTRYASAYVYDRVTGTSRQVNSGQLSFVAGLSGNGRYAAVSVGHRTPSHPHKLFVHDLRTGTDELIDPADTATGYPSVSGGAAISANGRVVAFGTGPYESRDVFVKDLRTGTVTQVDVRLDGERDDERGALTDLSANGRYVLFDSASPGLVPGAAAPGLYSYLRDLRTGVTRRIGGPGTSARAVSRDGRAVLMVEEGRLSVLDPRTGKRRFVAPEAGAGPESLTPRGDTTAFTSTAPDLVPDDTNGAADVFVSRLRDGKG